jgi:hypothetical protein
MIDAAPLSLRENVCELVWPKPVNGIAATKRKKARNLILTQGSLRKFKAIHRNQSA